jgi:hypothetical protein
MTNEEKVATVGMVAKDEDQGAAVHVSLAETSRSDLRQT